MKSHMPLLIFVVFLGVVLVVACNVNPQPAGLTPIPSLVPAATVTLKAAAQQAGGTGVGTTQTGQASAAVGAATFIEKCSACHGNQAEGIEAPSLRNDSFIQGGDQQVVEVISNGRSGTTMPAWLIDNGGPLTQGDIGDIVAYLHTLQNTTQIPKATEAPTEVAETPPPATGPTPEPAQPSGGGNPGPAANLAGDPKKGMPEFGQYCATCHGPQGVLGIPNPGSEDGSVPVLNPIDPTLINPDPKVFAANLDRFLENGSIPEGASPLIAMPAFGDHKLLDDQTMANLIAYVIQLNSKK